MIEHLEISEIYNKGINLPIIDVRSPKEFNQGHIPNAFSIPLFDNDERAEIGTVYKQVSKEKAIELGYKIVNPKLQWYVDESFKVAKNGGVIVHCWRGGMRSHSFAEHLLNNGFKKVYVITGGYKAYRQYIISLFEKPWNIIVVGGYTGSGKTHILLELEKRGHQVIDLEGFANHKGSAFGGIGQKEQPTSEQFENNIFEKCIKFSSTAPLFVEDESINIGKVNIPIPLFAQMKNAVDIFLDIPKEIRAKQLAQDYNFEDNECLIESLNKITKRLGGLVTQQATELIKEHNYAEAALKILSYYDKTYANGFSKRDSSKVKIVKSETIDFEENATKILNCISNI